MSAPLDFRFRNLKSHTCTLSMAEEGEDRFDGVLLGVAQQHTEGISQVRLEQLSLRPPLAVVAARGSQGRAI